MSRLFLSGFLVILFVSGCVHERRMTYTGPATKSERADSLLPPRPVVKTGAQVLVERHFSPLAGKRVGLITNHTAMVSDRHLIDVMAAAPEIELAALFGPEHGLRGTAAAGDYVSGDRDPRTGVRIFSLYSANSNKPTPEMLADIDVLVFDIQDVGARFYTYISTMGLAMQAAAEKRIPFVVLDRPNPLGGTYVSGYLMENDLTSFVGMYTIPVAHGMTVGELALMIKGEKLLPGLEDLELEVVRLDHWRRSMLWPATGLPWIPPSPNIPSFETALVYPGACLFEATSASEGRGTEQPFLMMGAPWVDAVKLARGLNKKDLPGVQFQPVIFTPHAIPGKSANPKLKGQTIQGIYYHLTDPGAFQPLETGIYLLEAFLDQARELEVDSFIDRPDWLARLSGSHRLYNLLSMGIPPEQIISDWNGDRQAFENRREPYLLYP